MRIVLTAAALGLLSWGAAAHAEDRAPDHLIPQQAQTTEERPMLSQGDPQWKRYRFGNTTVGKAGCLALSLMDALVDMGLAIASPQSFIRMLSESRLFTKTGLLIWDLGRLFPVTVTRLSLRGRAAYTEAVNRLSQGAKVLLEVRTVRGTLHWVVASKAVNGDFEVRDPDGGRIGLLSSLYGGTDSLRGLAAITQS